VCDEIDFSDTQIETARFDVDGDGDRDLIIRISGGFWCGSHGCSTDIYLSQDGRLHWAEPPLVTDGPVMTCKDAGKQGLRFVATGPCFIFKRPKSD